MLLTLETTTADDEMIDALARSWGVTENEAVLRCVREAHARLERERRIDEASAQAMERYGNLFERLADS
jgi:hypothetical protein